jgi:intracellular multiplication protein IcmB
MPSFAESVVDNVEALLAWLSQGVKQAGADYCDIETVDDDQTIVFKDGTLATVIRLHGSFRMVGALEFREIHDTLSGGLKAYLNTGGHGIHVYFSEDPDSAARDIEEALALSIATAKRLSLNLDDLFEEDIRHLSKHCANENVFITLITRPSAITKGEQKLDRKAKEELVVAHPLPRLRDAPNVFAAIAALRTRHASYVSAVLSDLSNVKLAATVLDVHSAIYEQRCSVDPDFTDESWRACLIGDKIPTRKTRRDPKDMSGYFWPRVDRQIIPRNGKILDLKTVEVGDRIYAPMYIHYHSSDIKPFEQLFQRVVETRMPWRMTFLIESDGLGLLAFKDFLTAFLGFTNPDNKLTKTAIAEVRRLVRFGNELDVRYRVDFATWAPKDEKKLLAARASRLARAVQGWGGAEVHEVAGGDAFQGFISSCLAVSMNSVATPACAILSDVVTMLPLYRPASPWYEGGAVLYRTPDGKIWPYQPHSHLQTGSIVIMVAEPRSGKSVNGNQVNLALCLSPGITRLPLILIIDVGKASSGLISLLQYALPEHLRHLVLSIRLRMTPEFSINPGDTQLGCRWPLPHEEAFLINFISVLVTPLGKSAPADGMLGLVKLAVQESYKYYSDEKNPKPYSPNSLGAEDVDRAIEEYGIETDEQTTWWEIVDKLFNLGLTHEATLAQRYAVPLIPDIAAISRETQFMDVYGDKKTEDGEPLLSAFTRMLSESVRSYPILKNPTRFDLGEARIVSFDLDEVAKGSSAAAKHQSAVCYMLARLAGKNFYLLEDHIQTFPPQYRAYHEKRIHEIRQDKKHIQYDEFHRTKDIQAVRDQVIGDMREGGKIGVMVTLISQSVTDYDDQMLEFATAKIVISKQNEVNSEKMRGLFNMSDTAVYAVKNLIRPPGKNGSTFVGMFSTKQGEAVHLLNNTIGGIKLWAFSTTSEDAYVRDVLYSRIGPAETRQLMTRLYPGGSLLEDLDRRKKKLGDAGLIDGKSDDGVIEDMIKEILQKYESMRKEKVA